MKAFWHYFFFPVHQVWWTGNIWGNILASILTGCVVIFSSRYLSKLLIRQHSDRMAQNEAHHAEIMASQALLHEKLDNKKAL